jgi:hypothetical protein
MKKTLRSVLAAAIALVIIPTTMTSPASVAFAAEAVLPFARIATPGYDSSFVTATFTHDDSSLYFAESGGAGVHQIRSTQLLSSGSPIADSEDGMSSFRTEVGFWQNGRLFSSVAPGKDGHYWIYSSSANCTVAGTSCQSQPSTAGLWAIDTNANNRVSRIPLRRANGEGQDGGVVQLTGTPDGKYLYVLADRGGGNSGPDETQRFKIDAQTNTQIGLGVPVEANYSLAADDSFIYSFSFTTGFVKTPINGDPLSANNDGAAIPIAPTKQVVPNYGDSYLLQGTKLIFGSGNCATGQGKIGMVDTLTGAERAITLPSGVFPHNPQFGTDEYIYAFNICSSKVIKVDPESGAIVAQTSALTDVGFVSNDRPLGVMSNNRDLYVVGLRPTGGLVVVNSNPDYKPQRLTSPVVSGTGLQGTYLNAGLGTWKAKPVGSKTQQWYRCDKSVAAGLTAVTTAMKCLKISGATKTRYKVALVDENKYLTVLVKATNSLGSTLATARSFRVPKITAPTKTRNPVVSGTASVNSYLSATSGTWSGNPALKTSLQWYRCDAYVPAGRTWLNCSRIPGATTSRYKVKTADKGKYLTVLVTAANSVGSKTSTAKTSAKVG